MTSDEISTLVTEGHKTTIVVTKESGKILGNVNAGIFGNNVVEEATIVLQRALRVLPPQTKG